jgi:hypothetical protein
MAEKRVERRLAAILAADVAGYSRGLANFCWLGRPTVRNDETCDPKDEIGLQFRELESLHSVFYQ